MFEVIFYRGNVEQSRVFGLETMEDVVCAARTLWIDDTREYPIQGAEKVRSIRILLNDEPILLWTRRP
jgi:hypothetical protein